MTGSGPRSGRPSLFGGAAARQLAALLSLIALASFSSSAVGVLVPDLTLEFGSVRLVPWVVTGFLLASTILMVAAGWLVDAIGLRGSIRGASCVYLVASVGCAAAPTIEVLVAGRALQGVGAGWGLTAAIAGIGLAVPPELRARAFAANSIVWGGVTLLAPLVAAAATPLLGWRGLFVLNAVAALPVAAAGWRPFAVSAPGGARRFDATGLVLLAVAVSALALWAAGQELPGGPPTVVIGVVAAGAYLVHSGRTERPIIDRWLLLGWPFVMLHLAGAMSFGVVVGLDSYLPFYVRATTGAGPLRAAVPVILVSLGWTSATVLVARRVGGGQEARGALAGYVVLLGGLVALAAGVRGDGGGAVFHGSTLLLGLGAGAVSSSMFVLLQQAAAPAEMGRATSAHQLARGIGQTSGTALVATLVLGAVTVSIVDGPVTGALDGPRDALLVREGAAVVAGMRRAALVLMVPALAGLGAAGILAGRSRPPRARATAAPDDGG